MKRKIIFLLPFILVVLFFLVPFFWFKPGEVNLGGDGTRLYYYDPLAYLMNNALYGIIPSGIGGEAVSFYAIPYVLFLLFLKHIFQSPTTIIEIASGVEVSFGFLFTYLGIKELLQFSQQFSKRVYAELASLVGGIFYIIAPYMLIGWDRTLLPHSEIFLNPLMFYILLRLVITKKSRYIYIALFISLLFSFNFSFIGAPSFFSFFPLAIIFLALYTIFVRKQKLPYKQLWLGFIAFCLLQAFQVVPVLSNILNPQSYFNQSIFSAQARLSRGQDYFTAIAPSVKVSTNFLSLLQGETWYPWEILFLGVLLIVISGFVWNKGKTYLLTGVFFLIAFFLATANITQIGFLLYKELFVLPGFSIFRDFYGQLGYTYVFFYALLFGQALFIVFHKFKYVYTIALSIGCIVLLCLHAVPFFVGTEVHRVHYQSKNIDDVFTVDPQFEKALHYMSSLPQDAKVLTLPLSWFGYQVISGEKGGAYVGPSIISYIGGKNDFSSYETLQPFADTIDSLILQKNYTALNAFFSVLNIKYIFYDSDPKVYDSYFPNYPYQSIRDYLPANQRQYQQFIAQLPFKKIKDFGNNFHIYEIDPTLFYPHIYSPVTIAQTDNAEERIIVNKNTKQSFGTIQLNSQMGDAASTTVYFADEQNQLQDLSNNYHLAVDQPFISHRMDEPLYFFELEKEKYKLWSFRKNMTSYIDFGLLFMSKRIYELSQYNSDTPVGLTPAHNTIPSFSWRENLLRYKTQGTSLIDFIKNNSINASDEVENEIKVREQIYAHEIKLHMAIYQSNKSEKEKSYLYALAQTTFNNLLGQLHIPLFDPNSVNYNVNLQNQGGVYQMLIKNTDNLDMSQMNIQLNGQKISPMQVTQQNGDIPFPKVTLANVSSVPFTLIYAPDNTASQLQWTLPAQAISSGKKIQLKLNDAVVGQSNQTSNIVSKLTSIKPNMQYLISFDYTTQGKDVLFSFVDKQVLKDQDNQRGTKQYFTEVLNAEGWKTHQSYVTTDPNTVQAFLQFYLYPDSTNVSLEIKNVSVTSLAAPTIMFTKINVHPTMIKIPTMVIEKINPTKYIVHISHVTSPYLLVLSETFDSKWKLIDPMQTETGVKAAVAHVAGNILDSIIGALVPSSAKQISNTYLQGKVMEIPPQNSFIDGNTFSSWGKYFLPESSHILANGYANAWWITPENMKYKTSYDVIIEYSNENIFYISLFISSCTLLLCIVLFLKNIFQRKL